MKLCLNGTQTQNQFECVCFAMDLTAEPCHRLCQNAIHSRWQFNWQISFRNYSQKILRTLYCLSLKQTQNCRISWILFRDCFKIWNWRHWHGWYGSKWIPLLGTCLWQVMYFNNYFNAFYSRHFFLLKRIHIHGIGALYDWVMDSAGNNNLKNWIFDLQKERLIFKDRLIETKLNQCETMTKAIYFRNENPNNDLSESEWYNLKFALLARCFVFFCFVLYFLFCVYFFNEFQAWWMWVIFEWFVYVILRDLCI